MTAHVTIKVTRPDLNHLFLFEYTSNLPLLAIPSNFIDFPYIVEMGAPGFIESEITEFISWDQIYTRKEELRPDLRTWIENEENKFTIEFNRQFGNDPKFGPLLNPFSLTFTKKTTFDNIENATAYSTYLITGGGFDYSEVLEKTNNTAELYLNDTLLTY